MAVTTPLSASQAQQAPSTATLAEIQRKASLGIPLTDQSNSANNALYNSFKPASATTNNDTNTPKGLNLTPQPSASQQSFFSGAANGTPWAAAPTNLGGVAASIASSASTPPTTGNTPPKFDAAGIAASRVAAQRAALAGSVNAYDTSRKSAYDYAQGTTQGNRALLQFDNSNRGDQFGGSAREDLFRLQRSQGLEDTAANTQYNNDIAAENQKLADFDAGAPGMQSDIENTLNQQQFQNNISEAGVTGQYGGNPTLTAQQDAITNNRNTALDTYNQGQDTIKNNLATDTYNLNAQKQMADLTGYISDGKGGYMPTSTQQKQDLTDAWTATTNLGSVTPALSKLTGIPVGTPTQTAKNQAQQIAASNRNATNSENSTNNSNNNSKITQLMDVWKNQGTAPAGLESLGVKQGDKYTGGTAAKPALTPDSYKTDPAFSADVAHMKATPADSAKLDTNPQPFIDAYGYDGYLALRKAAGLD